MGFKRIAGFLSLSFFVFFSTGARADGLFDVTATGTSSSASANGSNVVNLVTDLTNNDQQFSSLNGQNYSANLNYAGIPNAVHVTQTVSGSGVKTVTVSIPSTDTTKTFSSANGDIGSQVRDYLRKDGLADLAAFQQVVSRTSPAGVVDGNPLALTALLTDAGYQQFAQRRGAAQMGGGQIAVTADGHGESWFTANGGELDAGGFSGSFANFTLASEYHFNDHIALATSAPFRWETIQGSDVYMGGFLLALPIDIIPGHGGTGLSWQLTPVADGGAVGSVDFASGGIVYGGQIHSALSYGFGDLTVTLADGGGYYHGADISVAGYDFTTDLNQWVLKNGIQITKTWSNVFLDIGASWTSFLRNTYVDGYLSPELGVGIRFGRGGHSGLRIGYLGNFGNGYSTNGGNIQFFFAD
jgi:hypothetical protein